MMRSFFLAVVTSALVATTSHAQTPTASLSLNFDKVPVIQLLQATYRNMLGKNYIIDPALSGDARVVTLSVKDLPKDQLKPTVDAVLRAFFADQGHRLLQTASEVIVVPPRIVADQPIRDEIGRIGDLEIKNLLLSGRLYRHYALKDEVRDMLLRQVRRTEIQDVRWRRCTNGRGARAHVL